MRIIPDTTQLTAEDAAEDAFRLVVPADGAGSRNQSTGQENDGGELHC